MVVSLVKNPTSATSNARLSISFVVEEVKEDESSSRKMWKCWLYTRTFRPTLRTRRIAYSQHVFI
jgi:hypothetical protein